MVFDWLFKGKLKKLFQKSSANTKKVIQNKTIITNNTKKVKSDCTKKTTSDVILQKSHLDTSGSKDNAVNDITFGKVSDNDVVIIKKVESGSQDNTVTDIPSGKISDSELPETQDVQQNITIQQEVVPEGKDDNLLFGVPVTEEEPLQNEEETVESHYLSNDSDGLLVVSGFSVVDGTIICNKSGKTIENMPIDILSLSLRAYHALKRGGISTVADLIQMNTSDFTQIRNFGKKLQQETLDSLNLYLTKNISEDFSLTNAEENAVLYDRKEVSDEDSEFINLNPLVADMPLSVRAKNCLKRNGICNLKMLMETSTETLSTFQNLGIKTLEEIIAYKENNIYSPVFEEKMLVRKAEIEQMQTKLENRIKLKDAVFNMFYTHALFTFESDALCRMMEGYDEIETFDDILKELLDENKIEMTATGEYRLRCIPVLEYIKAEFSDREQAVESIQGRMNGKTLESIAGNYGLTRERVRQLQNKLLNDVEKKCKNEQQALHEEGFRYLFEHYNISEELFCEITNEPSQTYCYLSLKGKNGKEELENIFSDMNIPEFIKINWEHFLRFSPKSPYIYIVDSSNRRVRKERMEIEKYILSEFCRNEVSFDEFVTMYNDFLNAHNLADEKKLQLSEAELRTRENHFLKCKYVFWKQGKRIRYYQIQSKDYTELFEAINLEQYKNIEISTLKLFRQHKEIMEQYDIRDEYELHNLLKKIGIDEKNPTASFGRTPYIKFGEFDRDAMVKEKLFENAPISNEKLAEIIFEEYGYQPSQVMAWFECIKEYYHDGMFSVEYEPLPDEHMELLKAELTDDFYYIHEIKKIYSSLISGADEELISSFNLKRMGFIVNSSYAVQNFSSAKKYFEHLFTSDDIVDVSPFNKRYSVLQAYYSVMIDLRDRFQIIEYEPYKYINIRRLQEFGVTENELRNYCNNVFEYIDEGTYFTVVAIRKNGFSDELDNLDFESWFYSSVLRADKRFRFIKIGGTVLFYKGNEQIELRSFLVNILSYMGSVGLDELLEMSEENYGMKLDRDKVRYAISDTGLYYDSVMETIYQDYDMYYRTIAEIDDNE